MHHFGSGYASQSQHAGRRYGEPPLLAIAQNALHAALDSGRDLTGVVDHFNIDSSFSHLVRQCLERGTAVEIRGRLKALEAELVRRSEDHQRRIDELTASAVDLNRTLGRERTQHLQQARSLRWLLRTLGTELSRRWRVRTPE